MRRVTTTTTTTTTTSVQYKRKGLRSRLAAYFIRLYSCWKGCFASQTLSVCGVYYSLSGIYGQPAHYIEILYAPDLVCPQMITAAVV